MSKYVSGLLGAVALVASLGAAQFAVGHDLSGPTAKLAAAAQSDHVNRSAKADRPVGIAPVAGKTIVTQVGSLNDTSVAIRVAGKMPQREGKAETKVAPRPVACEAPASVLTEVAKVMESGRCLT